MKQGLGHEQIKDAVKQGYTQAVRSGGSCCSPGAPLVRMGTKRTTLVDVVGYAPEELEGLPGDAVENSFGCGNPLLLAEIRAGDVVLDIGSGAGLDCLIAAQRVASTGRVIGLDMTTAMIEKARENARRAGVTNVEFRLGDAESMPVDDASVDWVISNCVINLAPDKPKLFAEVYRVLKPGGQVSISDIVLGDDLPDEVVRNVDAMVGCVAGAVKEADYLEAMRAAGLAEVAVSSRLVYGEEHLCGFFDGGDTMLKVDSEAPALFAKYRDRIIGNLWSARIRARKRQ